MKILYVNVQKLSRKRWGPVKTLSIYTHCRKKKSIIKDALKKFKAYAVPGTYNISIHINDTATEEGVIQTDNALLTGTGYSKVITLKEEA